MSTPTVVTVSTIPAGTQVERRFIEHAWFRDSYRAQLANHPEAGVVDIFHAVFGHHPAWIKWVLVARNRLARWAGLEVAEARDILHHEARSSYAVGDRIGPWPIFALGDRELIAGRDNGHLDFRLSLLKTQPREVTITTFCQVHNRFGKVYLFFIVPFHKWGVKLLIRRALAAGRL